VKSIFTKFKRLSATKTDIASEGNMNLKEIYTLEKDLESDPKRVELAQKLTIDDSRPSMGLKGTYGLFASEKWWRNFHNNKIPKVIYNGVIEDVHFSGMHNESKSFTLRLDDGGIYKYSLVADQKSDLKLYKEGARLQVVTYIEKMKNGSEQDFVYKISIENT
jgi:hypothetical protein